MNKSPFRPMSGRPSGLTPEFGPLITHRDEVATYVSRAAAREQAYAREELELPLSKVELDLDWSVHSSVDDGAGRAAPGSVSDVFFDCCSS
jgi:hypothetical protein